ncbi:hypothetical protein FFK22_025205 [Mycobacterium sp. KBS0706]|uniref:SIR2 family protein n=1 Tax=Mycobacterium sp. KBS0706 TaxID=2578109 RepID=UPI00110F9D33|nr:SIR2 family protein [Mycobacterium sp. KBS0706]TSD85895.1 hypothetical protein FFK22_025205 [Mycobacterium sp. KBS0706]
MFKLSQRTYQRLRTEHAERRRPIAFWIGAGFSAPAGLPTWQKLKDDLIGEALDSLSGLEKDETELKERKLEEIKLNQNYWSSFETIKNIIGRTNFVASIREKIGDVEKIQIPELYNDVWRLPGVGAVLTLNLDGFVDGSHRIIRPQERPASFSGRDAPSYAHVVGARRPFIANLHGIIDDQTSWIFTQSDVEKLFSSESYRNFLSIVFGNMTVVFAGISAEDGAAGGTLARLLSWGWISERTIGLQIDLVLGSGPTKLACR